MNLLTLRKDLFLSEEYRIAFLLTIVLTGLFTSIVIFFGVKAQAFALLPLAAIFLFVIWDYRLSLGAMVLVLFVDFPVFMFSSAVWFSIPLGIAFILKYKDTQWKDFANPMTLPIVVYGLCILPSFLNALQPFTSLLMLFNVAAFLIVMFSMIAGVRSYEDLRRLIVVYLCVVLIDSVDVYRLAWLGEKRPFGFAGIMFVDYSALGVCLSATLAIISQGSKRILFLLSSILIVIALILTQTRNTWFSALITLCLLIGYLLIHPEFFGFSRIRLLTISSIGSILIMGVVAVTLVYNPNIEKRAVEISNKAGTGIDEWGTTKNSMISRLIIWDTALNAFLSHPVAGIGVYAFPYASRHYANYPVILYEKYVKGRSPHQTHFAVLAETGLIGFCGFLVFVVAALKYALRAVRQIQDERGKRYALVGAVATVYCLVSMMFTDSWLWGQGIILFGGILGATLANQKIAAVNTSNV